MSAARAEIVACARIWIGTPYRHQASVRGAGADCLGLIRGVWRALYGQEPEAIPPYTFDWSEADGQERLWRAAARLMRSCPAGAPPEPGQVLLFRMRDGAVAKHLGILTEAGDRAAFVHAYTGHGVIESPLSAPWARRVAARFEFP
ncbi:peptidase [Albidovulum sp.]|uniref:peptidase n=1 Tax=Albidovulum sp. TaxID=1872424 RepID=UPI001DB7A86C|nr:peptidase [Paracoccaceae bacterium]